MTHSGTSNLWLFVDMLARRRGMVVTIVALITLGAVVVSLLLPAWYSSEVLLLPPKDLGTAIPAGLSQMADIVSMTEGLTLPMMVTPSDVYARILTSRTLSEQIIDRFDLATRYETESRIDTYLALMSHTAFRVTDEGLLSITVEDRDPVVAADIANAYIDELNILNARMVVSRAKQNREFISDRLEQVARELAEARDSLEAFQTAHKAIDFGEQTRLAIEQATQLKITLAQLDLEIQMGEEYLSADNPDLVEKKRRRSIVRGQLRALEEGSGDSSYFSVPVSVIPNLRGRYENLYTRVRVNERLYNILLEQNEQARIAEQESTPTISVLDSARVAEVRSRPQRTRIVLGSLVVSLLMSVVIAAMVDYTARMQQNQPQDYDRLNRFVRAYFGWLPGVGKKR
ncbi:MAG: GNVR domain-containing protein [candidate division Zixibacteria bacterium]|nr:GNVR domain-containing protein [candidate division Zixibacteria bacterium]